MRGQFFVEESVAAVFRMRDEEGQIRVKLGASGRCAGFKRDTNVTLRDGATSETLTPGN